MTTVSSLASYWEIRVVNDKFGGYYVQQLERFFFLRIYVFIKIYYLFYIPTLTEGETNTRNILMVGAGAYWDQGETW